MIQGLWAAGSGMEAQSQRLDALADDIANVQTVGFKAVDVQSEPAVPEDVLGPGVPNGTMTLGVGVVDAPPTRDPSEGALVPTGRPLDLAIVGPGFFRVKLPDGTVGLTRAGDFTLDASGDVVDPAGNRLLSAGGQSISLPAGSGSITVASDGTISATSATGQPIRIGTLALAQPVSPDGLSPGPGGVWLPSPGAGTIQTGQPGSGGLGKIQQGALEQSNTDLAEVTVAMILAQQAYTLNAKAVQTADQMWAEANQLRA